MEYAFSLGKEQDCAVSASYGKCGEPELQEYSRKGKTSRDQNAQGSQALLPSLVNVCEELGIFPGLSA